MTLLRACLLTAACVLPTVTWAQWQWVDSQGHRVFSDRAPPPEIPSKNILRQPGPKGRPGIAYEAAPATAAAATSPAAAAASAPKLSGKDAQLEERRKQAEAAEAERKKVADEAAVAARAENCKLAKRAKASLDSGQRISVTNEKGEREILDDQQRAAELRRSEMLIARDCAPTAQ